MSHFRQFWKTFERCRRQIICPRHAGSFITRRHGQFSERVLKKFKSGEVRALLVSDLAARGLDIPNCDCVINLELPTDEVHYVHRAGRTGRMGAPGVVVSICEQKENFVVDKFAQKIRH